MDEILQHLETRIKKLIAQHDQLKNLNDDLRQIKNKLNNENEFLVIKQYKTISQVEMLVSKLKALEKLL